MIKGFFLGESQRIFKSPLSSCWEIKLNKWNLTTLLWFSPSFPQVCKLLRHISPTDSLHVQAKYAEINLRIYGPQLAVAAKVLCSNPTSKIAKENFEVFVDMWQSLMDDVASLTNEMGDVFRTKQMGDKNFYMSLPRPGVSETLKLRRVLTQYFTQLCFCT